MRVKLNDKFSEWISIGDLSEISIPKYRLDGVRDYVSDEILVRETISDLEFVYLYFQKTVVFPIELFDLVTSFGIWLHESDYDRYEDGCLKSLLNLFQRVKMRTSVGEELSVSLKRIFDQDSEDWVEFNKLLLDTKKLVGIKSIKINVNKEIYEKRLCDFH